MGKIDKGFWENKKVFISGNTGFKGSWLTLLLKELGSQVYGYALKPDKKENLYDTLNLENQIHFTYGDIRDKKLFTSKLIESNCDIAFHLAAQPLVRESYKHPVDTFTTNINGTINFFEGIRSLKSRPIVINVTSDKCYENNDDIKLFNEDHPMGGHDPYSCSKGCAELITKSYRSSFFNNDKIKVSSVRAGNVIGGGDWSSDRLIPDIIRNFQLNKNVKIRNPHATRPWQHVLDPLRGYILLAEKMYKSDDQTLCSGWNFGSKIEDAKQVRWICDYMISIWDSEVNWEVDSNENPKEAKYLHLDSNKAKIKLDWSPLLDIKNSLKFTKDWYEAYYKSENMLDFTLIQIKKYLKKQDGDNT